MPMLLEDLAEETSASNLRAADRLDAEARALDDLQREVEQLEAEVPARDEKVDQAQGLRQKAVESARQATDYVIARAAEAEGVWRSALTSLRQKLTVADAERLLRNQLVLLESGYRVVRAAHSLWTVCEKMKILPERLNELDEAERRFLELAADAKRALEHRGRDWQPTDPDRLALGLQLARAGKTVKTDEAHAWFRREPS